MKALYFSNYDLNDDASGVSKKIKMQLDGFFKNEVEIIAPVVFRHSFIDKLYTKLPFTSTMYDIAVSDYINNKIDKNIRFVYMRHDVFTRKLVNNLKKLKRLGIKIFYEIPTYPYDRNEKKVKNIFMRLKDKKWRNVAGQYIDYIVDYSGAQEIFGAKTINISNGVNPDFIEPKKEFGNSNDIHLIGVALIAPVHAFDRVIESLKQYYLKVQTRKVYFHIVGDGDAKQYLIQLVRKYQLEEYVLFHGVQYGDSLDALYNLADIGVGVLGIHRRYKNQKVSSLKTKEYSAKGIPFISSEIDDAFEKHECDFKYMLDQDDTAFDVNDMINWYDRIVEAYGSKQQLSNHIRNYAYNYLTWKEQISKIITNI